MTLTFAGTLDRSAVTATVATIQATLEHDLSNGLIESTTPRSG